MKTLVVNCSKDYNLATAKITAWLKRSGHEVKKLAFNGCLASPETAVRYDTDDYKAVFLSALYTWDLPFLVEEARKAMPYAKVEIGGPAASIMPDYVFEQTGVRPVIGLDKRFDSEPARYLSTYTSRGCIRNCEFCSVPTIEGKLREMPHFLPASYVLDANILACSKAHIESVCEKLSCLSSVDFLHGLDARLLRPWHVELFLKKIKMLVWRFTFDSLQHEMDLRNILGMLEHYGIKPAESIIVYCLYGFNDTPNDAYERVGLIMSLGAHPYAMRFQPLDALVKDQHIPDEWDAKTMLEFWDFCNKPTLDWLYRQMKPNHWIR